MERRECRGHCDLFAEGERERYRGIRGRSGIFSLDFCAKHPLAERDTHLPGMHSISLNVPQTSHGLFPARSKPPTTQSETVALPRHKLSHYTNLSKHPNTCTCTTHSAQLSSRPNQKHSRNVSSICTPPRTRSIHLRRHASPPQPSVHRHLRCG